MTCPSGVSTTVSLKPTRYTTRRRFTVPGAGSQPIDELLTGISAFVKHAPTPRMHWIVNDTSFSWPGTPYVAVLIEISDMLPYFIERWKISSPFPSHEQPLNVCRMYYPFQITRNFFVCLFPATSSFQYFTASSVNFPAPSIPRLVSKNVP